MCIGSCNTVFHEIFISENLYPYVYKAVIFVNFHRTEEVDPDKPPFLISSTKLLLLN